MFKGTVNEGLNCTYCLVGRGTGGDRALRAAVPGVGRVHDGNLLWRRSITSGSLAQRSRRSEQWEKNGSEFGVHLGCWRGKDCYWG
jgi:hypothetical protein